MADAVRGGGMEARLAWATGLALLAWKVVLLLILPIVYQDMPWSLGPAISLAGGDLRGVDFATYHLSFNQIPWLYFALGAGWFTLFTPGVHAAYALFMLLAVVQLGLIIRLLRMQQASRFVSIASVMAWFTSAYAYSFRFESAGMCVVLWLAVRLLRMPKEKGCGDPISAVLVGMAGLTHPVTGVVAFAMLAWRLVAVRCGVRVLLVHGLIIAAMLAVLYLPLVLLDPGQWWQMMFGNEGFDGHGTDWMLLLKFFGESPLLTVLTVYAGVRTIRTRAWTALASFTSLIILIAYFGRSFYFPYLVPVLLMGSWMRGPADAAGDAAFNRGAGWAGRRRTARTALAVLLAVAPILTHWLPMYWIVENPRYARTLRAVLAATDSIATHSAGGRIYSTPQLCLETAQRPGSRMMYVDFPLRAHRLPPLQAGDILLFHTPGSPARFAAYFTTAPNDSIRMLIPPVRGLRRFPYFRDEVRSDSVGLWIARITGPSIPPHRNASSLPE